jgi:hypothetical protein
MDKKFQIFGCFMKIGFDPNLSEEDFANLDKVFSSYIWGNDGINNLIKQLNNEDYGNDLKLILFQFNVKPTEGELLKLKEIEPYRKNEKAIGVPIIVNDDNFFTKSEDDRRGYLKQEIFRKMDLLSKVVEQKGLDTKFELLKFDLQTVLS